MLAEEYGAEHLRPQVPAQESTEMTYHLIEGQNEAVQQDVQLPAQQSSWGDMINEFSLEHSPCWLATLAGMAAFLTYQAYYQAMPYLSPSSQ